MKKALIVSNMLFALATTFFVNANTNAFNAKAYDGWEIVDTPIMKKPISEDWQIVEDQEASGDDMFFLLTGSSEKENRKKYNSVKTSGVTSLTFEDKQGKTNTVFFPDIDHLTVTSQVNFGSCPTAIAAIATDQQSQSFIRTLRQSCSLAYDKINQFKNPKKVDSSVDVTPFYKNGEYMGVVQQVENKLIVSFPGTRFGRKEGLVDAIKDAKFVGDNKGYSSVKGVYTHAAFSKDVMEVFDAMIETIKSKSDNASEIWFTGHSKGGGEAILAAYQFASYVKTKIKDDNVLSKFREKNRVKVFTFSAPSVVNEAGKELFHNTIGKQNIICVHVKPDAVPKVTDYAGFVPVGVRMKIEKPTLEGGILNYAKGLLSSHSLRNYDEPAYKKMARMAQYVNANYSEDEASEVFFDARDGSEDDELFFDARDGSEAGKLSNEWQTVDAREGSVKKKGIVKTVNKLFNNFFFKKN